MAREYKKSMRSKRKNCVRKLRIYRNMLQKDVAELLHMSPTTYRDIEENTRHIRLSEKRDLAELFEVSENQLYEEETND